MTDDNVLRDTRISNVIKILLLSAFYSDNSDIKDPYLNYLGLGKIVYSKNVRDGAKAVIDLCDENRHLKESKEYLEDSLKTYKEISDEIINQYDFEILTDEEKKDIRKYIENIMEN